MQIPPKLVDCLQGPLPVLHNLFALAYPYLEMLFDVQTPPFSLLSSRDEKLSWETIRPLYVTSAYLIGYNALVILLEYMSPVIRSRRGVSSAVLPRRNTRTTGVTIY